MDNLYLKKTLKTNVPELLIMKKRVGSYPETDFTTKEPTGQMQYLYVFTDALGRELKHYAKAREEETLSLFSPGENLQVVLQETMKQTPAGEKRISFLVWTPPEGSEARAAVEAPLHGNTATARMERQHESQQDIQRARDCSIILQAFTKSWIESGNAKTPDEADHLAREQYELHRKSVAHFLSN